MADNKKDLDLGPGFIEVPIDQPAKDITQDASGPDTLKDSATDIGRGLYSGLTFDVGPKIAGPAIGATIEKAGDILSGKEGQDWLKSYYEKQKEAEAGEEESKQRSPYLYGGSQILGMAAPALLTSGAGLAAGGSEAALGAAAKKGLGTLAGELAGTSLTTGGIGAVQAGAESKGKLLGTPEEQQQLGEDVKSGFKTGALLGPAFELGIGGARAAKKGVGQMFSNIMEESPLMRQMGKSRAEGLAGKAISDSEAAVSRMGGEQIESTRNVANKFLGAEDTLGQAIQQKIQSATDQGIKVNITDPVRETIGGLVTVLEQHQGVLGPRQVGQLTQQLGALESGQLSPKAAYELRKQIIDISQGFENPDLRKLAYTFQNGIKESLETSVPGLKGVSKAFSDLRRAGSETILAKGEPSELADVWVGDLNKPKAKLSQAVTDLLEKATMPGTAKMEARRTLSELVKNLGDYEGKYPGLLDKLGIDPNTIGKDILNEADKFAIARQSSGYEPRSNPMSSLWSLLGGGATTGRGQLISKANIAGRVERAVASNPVVDASKTLFSMPAEGLKTIGQTLQQTPGLESLGQALLRGIENSDVSKRNAALFTILQNPKARALIGGSVENKSQDENLQPSGSTSQYGEGR